MSQMATIATKYLAAEESSKQKQDMVRIASRIGVKVSKTCVTKRFEPYVTTKKTGTGLGLAIVRKIIESIKNKIEVANRKGIEGTHINFVD